MRLTRIFFTVVMLITFILITVFQHPLSSFIPGINPYISANPSNRSLHFLLQDWLHEFPDSLPIILSIPVFYVFPLFSCWFRAVDWVGSCQLLIARQSSISYRIVAATHRLWSRIRQVAPLCIILRFLGPTRVCPFKRHMDRFCRVCCWSLMYPSQTTQHTTFVEVGRI